MSARNATILKFAAFLAIIAAGLWAAAYVSGDSRVQALVAMYGYPGLFVLSLLSGFNLAVPIPIAAFLPALVAAGLDTWACIAIMTVGMTTADSIAFFVGRAGREVVQGGGPKALERIERMRSKHAWAPVAAMFVWACFAPFPNEVLAAPLGFMGFRARHIIPAMVLGNLVFNSLIGFGVVSLFGAL